MWEDENFVNQKSSHLTAFFDAYLLNFLPSFKWPSDSSAASITRIGASKRLKLFIIVLASGYSKQKSNCHNAHIRYSAARVEKNTGAYYSPARDFSANRLISILIISDHKRNATY